MPLQSLVMSLKETATRYDGRGKEEDELLEEFEIYRTARVNAHVERACRNTSEICEVSEAIIVCRR